MANIAKQTTEQHLIDEAGSALLRSLLPKHWKLREYRPDFGLDFALEVFKERPTVPEKASTYETLGEHVFIQLKSAKAFDRGKVKIYVRGNVEKAQEKLGDEVVGEPETLRFDLETSELVTVNRMGTALVVLLVLADVTNGRCHFVCLNDYIDKILIPRHADYTSTGRRVVHVPALNDLSTHIGMTALRWYAKRSKLYAAFQKFVYQHVELGYAQREGADIAGLARHFAEVITRYDFWDDVEMWPILNHYGAAARRFLAGQSPGLVRRDEGEIRELTGGDEHKRAALEEHFALQEVELLWHGLSVLPRNYEEICREWFLPTSLGVMASYPYGQTDEWKPST